MTRMLLFAVLIPWVGSEAQQAASATPPTAAQQEPQVAAPKNSVDFYAGLRSNGGTDFMTGVEFSRRQPDWKAFGGAAFLEVVWADDTAILLGAMLQFIPFRRLMLETGPGVVFNGGSDFFWRVGGEYELSGRRLSLIPKLYLDFVHGTTVFGYGIAIAFGGR